MQLRTRNMVIGIVASVVISLLVFLAFHYRGGHPLPGKYASSPVPQIKARKASETEVNAGIKRGQDPEPVPGGDTQFDYEAFFQQKLSELKEAELGQILQTALYQREDGTFIREIVVSKPSPELSARAMAWIQEASTRGEDAKQSYHRNQINEFLSFDENFKIISVQYIKNPQTDQWRNHIVVRDAKEVEASYDDNGNPYMYTGTEYTSAERGTQHGLMQRYGHLVDHFEDISKSLGGVQN